MKNRIQFLKSIDDLLGPFLLCISPKSAKSSFKDHKDLKKILVIRPGGMGDAALLLPSIKKTRELIPGIKIDVLCESRNAGIFMASPFVNEIFKYDNPLHLAKMFKKKYDIIFDTEQSHYLSAFLCSFMKSPLKTGFAVNGRERVYNESLPYDQTRYEALVFLDLFRTAIPLEDDILIEPPYFFPFDGNNICIRQILEKKKPHVCLFPGATIDERHWPEARWAALADFFDISGYQVILLGGVQENGICKKITYESSCENIINLSNRLSILDTAWVLEKCSLLVSTDSGILHLGVLAGSPTVSLFGSGISVKWGPKGKNHRIIHKCLPCSPCTVFGTTPKCRYNNQCMSAITSEDVINASRELMDNLP